MTTRAFTLPRAPAAAVAELALPALTVTFGLQLLRLMIPTVMSVYRDRLAAPLVSLALFAFGVPPPIQAWYGHCGRQARC